LLTDPKVDFVGLSRSFGVKAERAQTVHEATDLLKQSVGNGGTMLIDVELDRAFR
jgi:thiamine pyrophosphate-dependent acetolactate synthase large subunit-like protein